MSDIKERLDKVRALIQELEFLEGKGLSNEVNIRIFCYEPENEMVVRHFVNQLETDQSFAIRVIDFSVGYWKRFCFTISSAIASSESPSLISFAVERIS